MKYQNLTQHINNNILRINKCSKDIITRLIKKPALYLNFTKCLSTEANMMKDDENLKERNEQKSSKKLLQFYDCFENNELELKNIPQKYLTTTSKPTSLYLVKQTVANKFVTLIKDDLLRNATHVIEMNPGLGYVTQELLKAGVPFVHLYESDYDFYQQLNELKNKFPERLVLENIDLHVLSKIPHTCESHKHMNILNVLKDVKKNKWEEASSIQLIGITNDFKFLKHIMISTIFRTCFMMHGRCTFYLAIPIPIFKKLTASVVKRISYAMFQILFNYKIYGTVHKNAFIPLIKIRKVCSIKDESEANSFYIVKMEPKPEFFTLFNKKDDFIRFWYFMRLSFYRPSAKVIPVLEKFVPAFGLTLIAKDYTIFTEFRDLTNDQIIDLFMELKSSPEFESSTFIESVNEAQKSFDAYIKNDDDFT